MIRQSLGAIGVAVMSIALLVTVLSARQGAAQGASNHPIADALESSEPVAVETPTPPDTASLLGPQSLTIVTETGASKITSPAGCAALNKSAILAVWCALVFSATPVSIKPSGLTVADEPTFKAIMARGLLANDDTVCDIPGVAYWIRARTHERDTASWCRSSFAMLREQGSFTVTDIETNTWVTVEVEKP